MFNHIIWPRPRYRVRSQLIDASSAYLSFPMVVIVSCLLSGCNSTMAVPPRPKSITVGNSFSPYGSPVWTPDALRLYFNYRPLARISEEPPGSGVYYYFDADSLAGIYRVDLTGQNQYRIFPRGMSGLELSSDGQYLYCEDQTEIWRYTIQADSVDAGSALQITNSASGAFGPSISSSGTRLLYNTGGPTNPRVYLISATGGTARGVGGDGWITPDWQPNDSSFAFVGYGPIVRGVGIVDTFGVGAIGIRADGNSPRWSPDGTRIAFLSAGGSLNAPEKLWVMNRDGSGARQITNESVVAEFNWSPDGTEIAYVRFASNDTSYINGTIWVINPTTLATRQITVNPRP
jgi:dipeptidyl aminopeptidase/acylaminoacyl peptidase